MAKKNKLPSLSTRSMDVQDVTARHRTACVACSAIPKGRRLRVICGHGRWAKTTVYCVDCFELAIRNIGAALDDMREAMLEED